MKSRSKKELMEIAKAIFHNECFTNLHIRDNDKSLLFHVFMPLGLLGSMSISELTADPPGLIFEYYRNAIERMSINGYPIFPSCHLVSIADAKNILDILERLQANENQLLKEWKECTK